MEVLGSLRGGKWGTGTALRPLAGWLKDPCSNLQRGIPSACLRVQIEEGHHVWWSRCGCDPPCALEVGRMTVCGRMCARVMSGRGGIDRVRW
jgi:hypothetical protein